uniref:Retinoblastoma-binding protein 6 n=1 Tax=Aegilops tauschii TaxID=37682 RepID=M8BZI3_AEGTA
MAVYYKFKSARDYDSIPIEGQFISVLNLKEMIFESKHLGRGTDFDLMISNAQTDEEYADESIMIPKNTSVLIRRIPGRPRMPIVTEPQEAIAAENRVEEIVPSGSAFLGDSSMKYPEESEWDDEFGNSLYVSDSVPSQPASQAIDASSENQIDEDSKIKALIDTAAVDYSQIPDGYGSGRGYGRGMGGRMMAGRGFGRGMGRLDNRSPPPGYICHRCKVPGHFIQHCPTNGDTRYDVRRMKPPTGIPKSMLMATPDGSYALPSGAGAVLKPNEAAFEREIEGLPTTRSLSDLPPELRCPLCKEVMKDAVLTSKCCFKSFCDKCIRDYIINKSMCVCGATSILADDLLPNRTLRETISRILEAPPTSSTENAGSMVQVQDMESALPVPPKVRSPAVSAASKEEPKALMPVEESPDAESQSGLKANIDVSSSDNKVTTIPDITEGTMDSKNSKNEKTPEMIHVAKESQEKLPAGEQAVKKKKKKKVRAPGNAEEQWNNNYQDFGPENFAGMPLGPQGGFNPYWGGGMPLPIDYMGAPFPGPMPYMGYPPPGPFDPFGGGVLPQDPFMPPAYMMPTVPRDLSELAVNSMGMNMGPPVVRRDEFEPRKPDGRRREMDRLNGSISTLQRVPLQDLSTSNAPGETLGWLAGQATAVLRRHPFLGGAAGLPMEATGVVTGGGGRVGSSARIGAMCCSVVVLLWAWALGVHCTPTQERGCRNSLKWQSHDILIYVLLLIKAWRGSGIGSVNIPARGKGSGRGRGSETVMVIETETETETGAGSIEGKQGNHQEP